MQTWWYAYNRGARPALAWGEPRNGSVGGAAGWGGAARWGWAPVEHRPPVSTPTMQWRGLQERASLTRKGVLIFLKPIFSPKQANSSWRSLNGSLAELKWQTLKKECPVRARAAAARGHFCRCWLSRWMSTQRRIVIFPIIFEMMER